MTTVRSTVAVVGLLLAVGTADAQTLSERLQKESPDALARAARESGSAVRGAILFTGPKLGCPQCHAVGANDLLGPDLTRLGGDVKDAYLVESLLLPSKAIRKGHEASTVLLVDGKQVNGRVVERTEKKIVVREATEKRRLVTIDAADVEEVVTSKTSSMPNNLVDQLADRGQFLDLLRYTMQLTATKSIAGPVHPPGGRTLEPELQGLVLLKEYGCGSCHADDLPANSITPKLAPDLAWSSGRIDPRHVELFVANPLKTKPGTTMPDVFGERSDEERRELATDLTHYFVSLSRRSFKALAEDRLAVERGREVFHSVGCVACHSPRDADGRELHAEQSVPLGPIGKKYSVASLVEFLENPLASRPSGRMPNMQLTHWEAVDVAQYLHDDGPVVEATPAYFTDEVRVRRGRRAFRSLGCASCHTRGEARPEPSSVALSKVRPDRGCLSTEKGAWPRFGLDESERTAIRAALANSDAKPTAEQEIELTMTALRCVNCHQRGTLGGVSELRDPHFQTTNPNLGPQGRLPPTLTNVGAKLNPKWLRQVLVEGRSIRPYVKTRMPKYGTANVEHLVELFGEVDELPPIEFPEVTDEKTLKQTGAEMAGTGGLNCIACHTFQLKQAANMPAVDLTEMAERLQKTWFHRYMREPQRFSQNTVMPSFWPAGVAMRKDVLEGQTDRQIEALWRYLEDGRQARTPRGLIVEPMKLLATDEAVMLRRKWPDVGKRGIGVGYPRQVNVVYDAEQMRLATIWQGPFADPGGVWRSQGHGQVRPLGSDLVRFAKGPDVDDAVSPWVVDDGRPPKHRFRGYTLDEKRRPRFRYEFDGVAVTDHVVDVENESTERPSLRRTVTLTAAGEARRAVFRAADGAKIEEKGKKVFVVDGVLTVRLVGDHAGKIVERDGRQRLHVDVEATTKPTELVVEYVW